MDAKQLRDFLKKCHILVDGKDCTGKNLLHKIYVPYGKSIIPFDEWCEIMERENEK